MPIKAQPHLAPRAQVGYCSSCGNFLGDVASIQREENEILLSPEWKYQQWVGKTVGELLSATPHLPIPPQREELATTILAYVESVAGGNRERFSNYVQADPKCFWSWIAGHYVPQLNSTLKMCFRLGISPLGFLVGNREKCLVSQMDIVQRSQRPAPSGKHYRKFDAQYLSDALDKILLDTEGTPLPMLNVARQLGYDHSYLLKKFPEHCRAISARYLAYQAQKRLNRLQMLCDDVREVAHTLHAQGRYPAQDQIAKLLGKRAIFREPEPHLAWREVLRELGLQGSSELSS